MKTLSAINFILAALFVACYLYQAIFAGVRLLRKKRVFTAQKLCRSRAKAVGGRLACGVYGQAQGTVQFVQHGGPSRAARLNGSPL